jgi:hypothetical protein
MLQNSGVGSDLTIENVWLMGQDSGGSKTAYEQIQLNAFNSRFTFDQVIFDRNDWHFLGPNASGCDLFVTNSSFRNQFGPNQQWEGLGVRFEVGADTVWFENNTFINIGFTPFQSLYMPINYFLVNHNTFVNVGKGLTDGALWKQAYIANNLFLNPYWHGQQPREYLDPDVVDEYDGFFGIDELPAIYGTDFERRIVFANNGFWRDEAFGLAMGDSIRMQPLFNDTTLNYFDAWDAMVHESNYELDPGFDVYEDEIAPLVPNMVSSIQGLRAGENVDQYRYWYDPGRDEQCFVCNIWPLPEDFSYSNATLQTGGTDGLPVGDLNWYPASKATYEANRDGYVAALEALAGKWVTLTLLADVEADDGVLGGSAAVDVFDGFAYYSMDGSGFIEWDFNLSSGDLYDLTVYTHLRNNDQRGQRILVNGTNIRNNVNYGEYYWTIADGYPRNSWFQTHITQGDLIAGGAALNLPAGSNTIRIEPSWGWQRFANMRVVTTLGDTVATLDAKDATTALVDAVCEGAEWCPTGFTSVEIGPGGSILWDLDFPTTGQYVVRVFYDAPLGGTVSVSVGGLQQTSVMLDDSANDVFSEIFEQSAGKRQARTLAIENTGANTVSVDYVQLFSLSTVIPPICDSQTEILTSECAALASLYNDTNGQGWNIDSGWMASMTPCSWYGVTCASEEFSGPGSASKRGALNPVTGLQLNGNILVGPVPSSVANLPGLTTLSLQNNSLTGPIPEEITVLTSLQHLNLGTNDLSGPIPTGIGQLASLQFLHLSQNGLSGVIPAELAQISSLLVLDLSDNELTGSIPPELGQLTNLTFLGLSNNHLVGTLPLPVALAGEASGACDLVGNSSLCIPDIVAYQALGDSVCGLPFDPACIPVLHADVKLLLEGAYAGDGSMEIGSILDSNLPLAQPFSDPIFDGTVLDHDEPMVLSVLPDSVIDWVLVSLRTGTAAATEVAGSERPALLLSNGSVVDTNGTMLAIHNAEPGPHYLVARHRNHASIMSADTLDLSDGIGVWDYTGDMNSAYTSSAVPMKDLGGGTFGMFSGDANADGQVTANDFNQWLVETKGVVTGYRQGDFNMDGQVTASDFNFWILNTKLLAKSQVPE